MTDELFMNEEKDIDNLNTFDMKEEDKLENLQNLLDDELLLENIKEQISNPINATVDNLNIFNNRIKFLKLKYEENIDMIKLLNEIETEFYNNILKEINIVYPFSAFQSINEEKLKTMIYILYKFLILDYRENVTTFLFSYIYNNRKSLVNAFDFKKKNVETIAMKKVFKNREEAVLIANLRHIIRDVSSMDHETSFILQTIIEDDSMLITNFMINNFILEKNIIIFNENLFSKNFFRPITEKYEDYSKIITDILQKFYDMFTKKV